MRPCSTVSAFHPSLGACASSAAWRAGPTGAFAFSEPGSGESRAHSRRLLGPFPEGVSTPPRVLPLPASSQTVSNHFLSTAFHSLTTSSRATPEKRASRTSSPHPSPVTATAAMAPSKKNVPVIVIVRERSRYVVDNDDAPTTGRRASGLRWVRRSSPISLLLPSWPTP